MKLWSDSFGNGERIPEKYAAGKPDAKAGVTFADNLNPHLAWSDAPTGTTSFTLICHDFDVPSRGDDVNKADREVPSDLPRVDFFHWVLVDVPPSLNQIAEGEFSRGFTARGKPGPATHHGARHGINDYTNWFAGDSQMRRRLLRLRRPVPAVQRLAGAPLRVHAVRAVDRAGAGRRPLHRRAKCARPSRRMCSPRRRIPVPTR